jgi:hypothetical protein
MYRVAQQAGVPPTDQVAYVYMARSPITPHGCAVVRWHAHDKPTHPCDPPATPAPIPTWPHLTPTTPASAHGARGVPHLQPTTSAHTRS